MNQSCLALDLMQLLLSSLAVFTVMALFVEGCLKFFNVVNPRVRVICRCLPILKLPLGIAFYGMMEGSILLDLNILSCKSYFKPWVSSALLSAEQLEMATFNPISLPQYLASQLPFSWLVSFFILIVTISAGVTISKGWQLIQAVRYLKRICRESKLCTKKIANKNLRTTIKNNAIKVLVSEKISTPTAFGRTTILFPRKILKNLSQEEFEAVLAHEVEHLRWKDPLVKTGCILIRALFWWIPINWWLKKIENDQEQACDASINRYGYANVALASAVVKTLKLSSHKNTGEMVMSQLASRKSDCKMRLQTLLSESHLSYHWTMLSRCGMAAVIGCFLIIGFRIC